MANLNEISAYKSQLAEALCTSSDLVELIKVSDGDTITGRQLMYDRVFPYAYVPDTTQDARTYVCFDIDCPSIISGTIKNLVIHVYVISHQSLMRLQNSRGMRIDVMAAKVDEILNGSTEYGLGQMELISAVSFIPVAGYHGRELRYAVKDFNRMLCGI